MNGIGINNDALERDKKQQCDNGSIGNVEPGEHEARYYSTFVFQNLLLWLRSGDWEKINETISDMSAFAFSGKVTPEYRYMLYIGMVSLCFSYAVERGVDFESVFGVTPAVFTNRIRNLDTSDEAGIMISDLCKRILASQNMNSPKPGKVSIQAKAYVEKNFSNADLTVGDVAANVYLNPGYLRSLYKKEMGLTINNYITQLRMNRARELIEKGEVKLSEVASLSGFNDAGYFSKCFRRFYGLSPSEYLKICPRK